MLEGVFAQVPIGSALGEHVGIEYVIRFWTGACWGLSVCQQYGHCPCMLPAVVVSRSLFSFVFAECVFEDPVWCTCVLAFDLGCQEDVL